MGESRIAAAGRSSPRRAGRVPVVTALAIAVVTILAGCGESGAAPSATSRGSTPTSAGGSGAPPALLPTGRAEDITTGLDVPWSIAFAGATPLVSERDTGLILEVLPSGGTREVGVVPDVAPRGEGGLLGLAVRNGELFAYSTATGGNRIQRFVLTGAEGSFGLGSSDTLVDGLPAARNHNGGRIAFGPDGMLYASVGDAGDRPSAQDLGALSGKILRMTPAGDVPDDNPFAGSLVYSYGHRNVQGMAWAGDGTMFASEFGQDTWDELNIIIAGGNYGWPEVEGSEGSDGEGGFVDPVQQWHPDDASPSGIAIEGDTIFIANLRGEVLRAVPVDRPSTATEHFAGEWGRLRDVVLAPDGTVWVVTNNTDGRGSAGAGDDRILSVALRG